MLDCGQGECPEPIPEPIPEPGAPAAPEIPETPETAPVVDAAPETPVTPAATETSVALAAPENPKTAVAAAAPETSVAPAAPETPLTSAAPESPVEPLSDAEVWEERVAWLDRIVAQARLRELQCPLVWTTAASYDGVLEDKLRDLVTLAPSTWDAIVREIVRVTRMVHTAAGSLDDIKATLERCYSLVRVRPAGPAQRGGGGSPSIAEPCPILAAYRPALLHVLGATFLTVLCVFERKNLIDVPTLKHIVKYDHMDVANRSAVWAIRAQVKLTCYLGLPAGASRTGTRLHDALLAASRAKDMLPCEGQWKALYGDLLPDDNPRKLTLLSNAVLARRSPFTVTCLSRYLYKLGDSAAFDLCAEALLQWPRSVHANVSYVLMYLSVTSPGKLSHCLAEQCLLRLQRLTPSCVFVAGLALELRLRTAEEKGAGDVGSGDSGGSGVDRGVELDVNSNVISGVANGVDHGVDHGARDDDVTPDHDVIVPQRPARKRAFYPVDQAVITKAMELYCEGSFGMVRREEAGTLRLDECNCVCCGECALRTFKAHGTLLVSETKPLACYSE